MILIDRADRAQWSAFGVMDDLTLGAHLGQLRSEPEQVPAPDRNETDQALNASEDSAQSH